MYTGVHTARVHSLVRTVNTAVFRACLHGRVPCTRTCVPCLRKVYTAVHGRVHRVRTVYTAVDRIHGCLRPCTRPVHGRVQGPYTAVVMYAVVTAV